MMGRLDRVFLKTRRRVLPKRLRQHLGYGGRCGEFNADLAAGPVSISTRVVLTRPAVAVSSATNLLSAG